MANGTRPVALVLALVIGLSAGWLVGCSRKTEPPPPTPVPTASPSPTPTCPPTTKVYTITVGPDSGNVSEKVASISSTQANPIVWTPSDTTVTNLVITFDPTGFPPGTSEPPFTGGQTNTPQVFQCTSSTPCGPQGVNGKLSYPNGCLYFKYKATWKVGGTDRQADAGIIIEK